MCGGGAFYPTRCVRYKLDPFNFGDLVMDPMSSRATLKRNARRAEYDPQAMRAILAQQQICHVAYVAGGEPRQIATLYFSDEQHLYLHGNRQSALLTHMAAGGEVSVSVMILDGVVVARSGFHCSMNYRSVTVYGRGEEVTGDDHRRALDHFVAALIPGHERVVREPTRQELAATAVVRVSLSEMVAKVRGGDPIDDEADLAGAVWAGVIPLSMQAGTPQPAADLRAGIELPAYIEQYHAKG